MYAEGKKWKKNPNKYCMFNWNILWIYVPCICIHCKNWGVKLAPVGVHRGPYPQVLTLHPRVST